MKRDGMKDQDSGMREDSREIRSRARKVLTKGNGDIYRGRWIQRRGLLYMVMVLGLREIMCLLSRVGGRHATFNGRRELRTISMQTQYKHCADIAW